MITHQLQVERRTAKGHRPKTDALPLDYATNDRLVDVLQGSREEWMNVFFICSGFYVFSTIVYAVLASGVEQPWAKSSDAKTTDLNELELELEINIGKRSKDDQRQL